MWVNWSIGADITLVDNTEREIQIQKNENICNNVDCNFRLRQRITESRLWPVEIMRSLAPLAKAAETKVRRICYQSIGSEVSSLYYIYPAVLALYLEPTSTIISGKIACVCVACGGEPRDPLPWCGVCGHGAAAVSWSQPHPRSIQHSALLHDRVVEKGQIVLGLVCIYWIKHYNVYQEWPIHKWNSIWFLLAFLTRVWWNDQYQFLLCVSSTKIGHGWMDTAQSYCVICDI